MGLFGFFVSVIGLGAMTKDAINDSVQTNRNYDSAKEGCSPTYFGSGSKMYSTQTGNRCSYRHNYITHHEELIDQKTGSVIEDLTASKNSIKTNNEIKSISGTDCVFYRTHEFDSKKHRSYDIYKSTKINGYFKKFASGGVDVYEKIINIEYDDIYGYKAKTNPVHSERYFADGTPYSRKKCEEMKEEAFRLSEIKKGKVILPYKDDKVEGFKHIHTGELYTNYKYYHPNYRHDKDYPVRTMVGYNINEYKKAKIVSGNDIGYPSKEYVLVPIEDSKLYDTYGIEIER